MRILVQTRRYNLRYWCNIPSTEFPFRELRWVVIFQFYLWKPSDVQQEYSSTIIGLSCITKLRCDGTSYIINCVGGQMYFYHRSAGWFVKQLLSIQVDHNLDRKRALCWTWELSWGKPDLPHQQFTKCPWLGQKDPNGKKHYGFSNV